MPGSETKKARDRERMKVKRQVDQAALRNLRNALIPFARATDVINIGYRVTEDQLKAAKTAVELTKYVEGK